MNTNKLHIARRILLHKSAIDKDTRYDMIANAVKNIQNK